MSFLYDGNVVDSHHRRQYHRHASLGALGSLASASTGITGIGPAVSSSHLRLGGGLGIDGGAAAAGGDGGGGSSMDHDVAAAAAAELRGFEQTGGGSLRHRHCGDEHPPGAGLAAGEGMEVAGECYHDGSDEEAPAEDQQRGDDVENVRSPEEGGGGDNDDDVDGLHRSDSGGEDGPAPKRRKRSRSQRNGGGSGSTTTTTMRRSRNYPATRKSRTRKLAPATEEAYQARDAALRQLERVSSDHRTALADLEDARLRVASAEERIRLAERQVTDAEDGVVDAELSDPSNQKWNDMYGELVRFKNEHGHCNVEQRGSGALGKFVSRMRKLHKIPADASYESLHRKPYRVRALERIGFAFIFLEEKWMENYSRLVDYREQHGDIDVPRGWDLTLYRWVRTQRENYRRYGHGDEEVRQRSRLNERRVALLEEVGMREFLDERMVAEAKLKAEAAGPPATILSATDARWERRYGELVAFKEEHGHTDVKEDGPLKIWLKEQRKLVRAFREGRNTNGYKLTDERARRLEELGGTAIVDLREFRWNQRYNELVAYRDEHGDCLVPSHYTNKQLAKWVDTMRWTYRRQLKEQENDQAGNASPLVLTAARLRLLNEVGFVWEPKQHTKKVTDRRKREREAERKTTRDRKSDEHWMQRYRELKAYREANGGSCVVPHHVNLSLYNWCRRWKHEYRKLQEGTGSALLSQKRVELLNEIGFFESVCDKQKDNSARQNCDEKEVAI